MKKSILLKFLFVSFVAITLRCKKSTGSGDDNLPPGGPEPPVVPGCTASKPAAENRTIFPADNPWNIDISGAAVDPYSSQIIAGFASHGIKADFGSGLWEGAPIGIPYVVVCGNQPKIAVNFTDYGDESDPGPYPIPLKSPIE